MKTIEFLLCLVTFFMAFILIGRRQDELHLQIEKSSSYSDSIAISNSKKDDSILTILKRQSDYFDTGYGEEMPLQQISKDSFRKMVDLGIKIYTHPDLNTTNQ